MARYPARSSGYETALVGELVDAELPVVVVNPRQVRDFARATGQLAKTDALDARMLALFGERVRPPERTLPDEMWREPKAVMARRRQVVEMLVAEQNRLGQAPQPAGPVRRLGSFPCAGFWPRSGDL